MYSLRQKNSLDEVVETINKLMTTIGFRVNSARVYHDKENKALVVVSEYQRVMNNYFDTGVDITVIDIKGKKTLLEQMMPEYDARQRYLQKLTILKTIK